MRPAIAAAHASHAALHGGYRIAGVGGEGRVKCLHAQLAFALATGGNPVGDWILDRLELPPADRCCLDDLAEPAWPIRALGRPCRVHPEVVSERVDKKPQEW
jgi:hypothetical protein